MFGQTMESSTLKVDATQNASDWQKRKNPKFSTPFDSEQCWRMLCSRNTLKKWTSMIPPLLKIPVLPTLLSSFKTQSCQPSAPIPQTSSSSLATLSQCSHPSANLLQNKPSIISIQDTQPKLQELSRELKNLLLPSPLASVRLSSHSSPKPMPICSIKRFKSTTSTFGLWTLDGLEVVTVSERYFISYTAY